MSSWRSGLPHLRSVPGGQAVRVIQTTARPGSQHSQFDALFHEHYRYVAFLAFRMVGQREDADDVVQEVFCALAEQLGDLQRLDSLKGWLATVTIRRARRKLERRRLRRAIGLESDLDYDNVAGPNAPHEQRLVLRQLYTALDKLPANERIAWMLRYIDDEAIDVVAHHCGVSMATAKRRIRAAHDRLTKELGYER
jgi:RNA polymerase sigma-70 factor (ECF subfamily)